MKMKKEEIDSAPTLLHYDRYLLIEELVLTFPRYSLE